ncbi:hypothetical protein AA0113_g6097 [Alternaria arborescens]|jgi:hypothetical protein|uniref:Uncharacterized protein n=3 Tax=Alternaria sect. Alternaria TaxID=2499237 RepID=A0A4Q4N9L3_ALTAL|nr:hypothetical protein AA0111_g5218 [Alternaria arborescens]RYN28676.1 hypothetical protein AA0115_g5710 [Alternaria tenuissima]RYN72437.1 hypothetical protein AA0117_g8528 [Alternaria alternata]RYN33721.1 hypothetical protein AA0112_g5576 [Alternaria arborescens]RYN56691.1 hypothetical protein AA0114_g2875 [Alternaria tenuissima]RYN64657.1 hypothetical protein AA0118_g3835 [Alternaria tenuissima]
MHLVLFITTLLTVTATSIAAPTDNPAETTTSISIKADTDLYSQACPGRQIYHWQGGGCETDWGNDCYNRCKNVAASKRCCMRTVGWYQDGGGCLSPWETCECTCKR